MSARFLSCEKKFVSSGAVWAPQVPNHADKAQLCSGCVIQNSIRSRHHQPDLFKMSAHTIVRRSHLEKVRERFNRA